MYLPNLHADAAADWMEWTWRRDLTAADRKLFFHTNELAGPQEFRLLGFGAADTAAASRLLVFDLADSALTANRPGPRLLSWLPSQYDGANLRLQVDLGNPPRPRTIYALSPEVASLPERIEAVSPTDPSETDGADEDLLVICHPDFLEGIAPLVAARRAQGLSVRLVSTREVYDYFNGGRPWPTGIRNYLRYLFRARVSPPSFVLLVGDASDDFTGANAASAPNFVPTQTVFSDARAEQGGELVSSDEWFVDNVSGLGEQLDFLPDMHIGRIPAGTPAELGATVDKILRYSDYGDALDPQDWRSSALLISDDEFSSSISFTQTYRYQGGHGEYRPPRRRVDLPLGGQGDPANHPGAGRIHRFRGRHLLHRNLHGHRARDAALLRRAGGEQLRGLSVPLRRGRPAALYEHPRIALRG
jgi:hypothetical protein